MALVFKVWDVRRDKKTSLALIDKEDGTLYENVILRASQKLEIDGSLLVLEHDGTVVDEDDVLRLLYKETFILLGKNENWEPLLDPNKSFTSTITVNSSSSIASPVSPEIEEIEESHKNSKNNICMERVSEVTWKNFPLPLHKLSSTCIHECEAGNRKNKQAISEMVHAVVDSLREIKTDISVNAYKYISGKIIDRFPKMFEDVDEDGCVIGNGNHSLICKLKERNNYLNRPHKRTSLKEKLHTTPKQRKIYMAAKAGCENWQPDSHEDPDSLDEKEALLKQIAVDGNFEVTEDVVNAFSQTYSAQRLFLNNVNTPTINQIREKYPILLTNTGITLHYKKLMNHSIENLENVFKTKYEQILNFGINQKLLEKIPHTEEEKHITCLKVIAKFFKEDIGVILMRKEKDLNSPYILETSATNDIEVTYTVYIEKQKIEEFSIFLNALQLLFASYYVFNMVYPKEAGSTMEFIERYMLKINPEQGSKNRKTTSEQKIISFINKLRDID